MMLPSSRYALKRYLSSIGDADALHPLERIDVGVGDDQATAPLRAKAASWWERGDQNPSDAE